VGHYQRRIERPSLNGTALAALLNTPTIHPSSSRTGMAVISALAPQRLRPAFRAVSSIAAPWKAGRLTPAVISSLFLGSDALSCAHDPGEKEATGFKGYPSVSSASEGPVLMSSNCALARLNDPSVSPSVLSYCWLAGSCAASRFYMVIPNPLITKILPLTVPNSGRIPVPFVVFIAQQMNTP